VVCLPNEEIFTGLAQMGYEKPSTKLTFCKAFFSSQWKFLIHTIVQSLSAKRTSWNEFSTAMDSAVICLSKGQRFNFSRVGKGCSGVETPLFENMLEVREVDAEEEVQVPSQDDVAQENVIEEIADDVAQPTSPLPPSPVIPPLPPHQSPRTSPSQAAEGTSILVQQVLDKCSVLVLRVEGLESANTAQQLEILKLKARGRQADTQAEIYNIDLDHTSKVLSMQEDSEVQEVVKVVNVAKLMTKVVTAATTQVVPAAKPAVAIIETLSNKDKGKGILVEDPKPIKKKDLIAMDAEYARKLHEEKESHAQAKYVQATDVQPKDAPAKGIQYIRRYHRYKKKPQSKSEARKNMIAYLKNTEGFKMAFFK
nr:hypothetical protein [Tanacetum cinerariifolium]